MPVPQQNRDAAPGTGEYLYKVLRRDETVRLVRDGRFNGSEDDLRDGFVHLSAANQVLRTLSRHFPGETGLFVGLCRVEPLGDALVWESSSSGEHFPHLYRPLVLSDVAALVPVPDVREDWRVPALSVAPEDAATGRSR